jgi:hypothetical protein
MLLLAALFSALNLLLSVILFAFSFFSELSINLFLCGGPAISVPATRLVAAAFLFEPNCFVGEEREGCH